MRRDCIFGVSPAHLCHIASATVRLGSGVYATVTDRVKPNEDRSAPARGEKRRLWRMAVEALKTAGHRA